MVAARPAGRPRKGAGALLGHKWLRAPVSFVSMRRPVRPGRGGPARGIGSALLPVRGVRRARLAAKPGVRPVAAPGRGPPNARVLSAGRVGRLPGHLVPAGPSPVLPAGVGAPHASFHDTLSRTVPHPAPVPRSPLGSPVHPGRWGSREGRPRTLRSRPATGSRHARSSQRAAVPCAPAVFGASVTARTVGGRAAPARAPAASSLQDLVGSWLAGVAGLRLRRCGLLALLAVRRAVPEVVRPPLSHLFSGKDRDRRALAALRGISRAASGRPFLLGAGPGLPKLRSRPVRVPLGLPDLLVVVRAIAMVLSDEFFGACLDRPRGDVQAALLAPDARALPLTEPTVA